MEIMDLDKEIPDDPYKQGLKDAKKVISNLLNMRQSSFEVYLKLFDDMHNENAYKQYRGFREEFIINNDIIKIVDTYNAYIEKVTTKNRTKEYLSKIIEEHGIDYVYNILNELDGKKDN